MDLETKPIQRDSLVDLLDASRAQPAKPHAHTVKRTQRVMRRERTREPSALRGLIVVLVFALAIRQLVVWIF